MANPASIGPEQLREVASLPLPTAQGRFELRAFEAESGWVHLALVLGTVDDGQPVLTRLHSECLTGDALGSLRCDCGVQLRWALRAIAAEGRGVLVYLTGQEGRGIGLVNKLRAYVEQDAGADTVEANLRLALPADPRRYDEAAAVLTMLGVRSVRLMSNNPRKAQGLRGHGLAVVSVDGLATAAHIRNRSYLQTKERRLGHVQPAGPAPDRLPAAPVDVATLVGSVRPRAGRPYVLVKYAQTLDGRIATSSGDSKWISGEPERRVAHALRAAFDAVLVGRGTVDSDDPQLTVRLVPGASPLRVVLDSTLRTPLSAKIFDQDAPTLVMTRVGADPQRWRDIQGTGAGVRAVAPGPGGVCATAALSALYDAGVRSLLVEGGARVITSLLHHGLVDRLVVSISPTVVGAGVEAVGPLGVTRVADGIHLTNRCLYTADDDVLLGFDVGPPPVPD